MLDVILPRRRAMSRDDPGGAGRRARYERLGFVREGLKRRVRKIDGRYDDT
jgi:hypothetical protein